MKANTWMPLYVADYLRDTLTLTRDEHGAYLLLIMAAWNAGGRLPNRPRALAAIAKATLSEWEDISASVLPFFEVDGNDIIHPRVIKEIEKAQRLSDARRESGARGGRPKKQTESKTESKTKAKAVANRVANEKQNETPSHITDRKKEPSVPKKDVSRGTRIPADWAPSDIDRAFAIKHRVLDVDLMAEHFLNYWLAKSGPTALKRDWTAAWRTWVLKDAELRARPADDAYIRSNIQ